MWNFKTNAEQSVGIDEIEQYCHVTIISTSVSTRHWILYTSIIRNQSMSKYSHNSTSEDDPHR